MESRGVNSAVHRVLHAVVVVIGRLLVAQRDRGVVRLVGLAAREAFDALLGRLRSMLLADRRATVSTRVATAVTLGDKTLVRLAGRALVNRLPSGGAACDAEMS